MADDDETHGSNWLAELAHQINKLADVGAQRDRASLEDALTGGDRLLEAKAAIKHHRAWVAWLKTNVRMSRAAAYDWMMLAANRAIINEWYFSSAGNDLTSVRQALRVIREHKRRAAEGSRPTPPPQPVAASMDEAKLAAALGDRIKSSDDRYRRGFIEMDDALAVSMLLDQVAALVPKGGREKWLRAHGITRRGAFGRILKLGGRITLADRRGTQFVVDLPAFRAMLDAEIPDIDGPHVRVYTPS